MELDTYKDEVRREVLELKASQEKLPASESQTRIRLYHLEAAVKELEKQLTNHDLYLHAIQAGHMSEKSESFLDTVSQIFPFGNGELWKVELNDAANDHDPRWAPA